MSKSFKINKSNNSIFIVSGEEEVAIRQAGDMDINFSSPKDETNIEISMYTRNYIEREVYKVFEFLIKQIIGRYVLNNDHKKSLPSDFINLDNKTIIWHSDSGNDNFHYNDYEN